MGEAFMRLFLLGRLAFGLAGGRERKIPRNECDVMRDCERKGSFDGYNSPTRVRLNLCGPAHATRLQSISYGHLYVTTLKGPVS